MVFKLFSVRLGVHYGLLFLSLTLTAWLVQKGGYSTVCFLLFIAIVLQAYSLLRFIHKTNSELNRFLHALRHNDYSQRFDAETMGAGFHQLSQHFQAILDSFHRNTAKQHTTLQHLKALVEHVPVPLLSLHHDGRITLWNHRARKLVGISTCTNLEDLKQFGEDFYRGIGRIHTGDQLLLPFGCDGMEHTLIVTASQVIVDGQPEMLISLQNIQSELDGAQLQAWQDLVRVLTHEIMNSITPIASLAKTSSDLIDDIQTQYSGSQTLPDALSRDLDDVAKAVETVARRSDNLTQFVNSYRRLTRLPDPKKTTFPISDLVNQVFAVASHDWPENWQWQVDVEPTTLALWADKSMVEQALINLLKNAEQAVQESDYPTIRLRAFLNTRGHAVLEVSDNGTGIPDQARGNLFVPFFTTKKEGSGVGLALTRQIMIRHGGSVKAENNSPQGATFTLTF